MVHLFDMVDVLLQLSFSYPSNPTQLVLDNTTFFFPAGQTTFVIGHSGSGKSTLSKILMKFYEPTAGHLFIDGYPIQALDPDWARVSVSLVQQQSVLFNESIFLNIAFGQPNYASVTKELVQLACQTALLQHTIDGLPKGLDTIIGADNNLMSGGQVQRIAIARARLRDAPILVLDEATSAMDYITKSLVMEAIRKWRKGKTTIIITHDSSQIADDDYLYVLERGQIVHEGYRYALEMDGEVSFETSLRSTTLESFFPDSVKSLYEKALIGDKSKLPDAVPSQAYGPVIELDKEFKTYPKDVSQILSLNQEVLESSEALDREASCGLPTSPAHAIALRADNVSRVSKVDFQHIPQIPLSKPLPTLPHETMSTVDEAALHWSVIPTKFELLDMGHYNNTQNCRERIKLEQFKNNVEVSWNSPKGALLKFWFSRSKNKEHNGSSEQKRMTDILKTVWPSLPWRGRMTLVLGFTSAFISAIATPAFSYALSRLLSTLSMTSGQAKETLKWGSSIIGLAVVDGLSTYLWRYCFEDAGQRWVDSLRVRALKRIIAQPKAWFERDKNASSHITECLDRDVEEMRNLVGRFVGTIFMVVLMISIATIASFIVCWKITLASIATFPFMYIFTRIFGTVSSIWEMRLNKASDAITKVLSETFSNISTVRELTLEGYFKQKHAEAIQRTYNVGRKRAIYDGILFGVSNSTINFFIAIILYYSAVVIVSGEWSVQDAVLAIMLLLFSAGNANAAISSVPQISSSCVTATRVLELANMPRIASHEASGKRYLRTPLPICLNSLSFTYPSRPETEVLHQVSMTFTAGSSTAIVGSSGSGKSTIAALLFGLYPPNEPLNHHTPSLTFAGCSVFDCNIQSLREKMAVVSQAPVLFPNTIAYNIAYGLPEDSTLRSPQNIQTAAEEAGIHEFIISLPNGYSTKIWDGGQGLSGGQVQRIAIARALIRRPAVLVLDEPTSALDAESAGVIRDTMVRLSSSGDLHGPGGHLRRENMAAIIITHSVEMMRVVGNIIVLDSGHVVEQGGFNELARKGGAFTRLITGNN
jgi:ATP-binding cassette, subfamily B (MDR/TAP), member 1